MPETQKRPSELNKEEKAVLKQIAKQSEIGYIAKFPNLIDLVENESGELEFFIFDSEKPFFSTAIDIEGKTFQPPPITKFPPGLLFPRKEKLISYLYDRSRSNGIKHTDDTDDTEHLTILTKTPFFNEWDTKLYEDLIAYHEERSELPDKRLYNILVLWEFHTYFLEKADFSPIIYFLGLPEKGKSRTLKSMIYVARRGLRKASLSDAQILRDCTHLDAVLALDMMDLWKKIDNAGSQDVFLNRPERGLVVSRVNRPEKGPFEDTDYYEVFGPTIFATNEIIHEILATRAIPIIMRNSRKKFNIKIKPEDALSFKEKLTAWRASTYNLTPPTVERIAESRLGDICEPLYQILMMVNPKKEKEFKEIIKEIEAKRIKEKTDSSSGEIFQALLKCESLMMNGHIKNQLIVDEFNKDKKTEKEKLTARIILNRLKTMGFEKVTEQDGSAGVLWNLELIDTLKVEFGLT